MDKKYKISIIVAIYNIERYIQTCIDSLVSQTYENIEIILIDDGSTDLSGTICKKMEKLDQRIKYFYKKNGGLSSARNFGMEKSTGDYIMFVDGDDYLDIKAIEILSKYIDNIDIVCFNYIIKTDAKEKKVFTKKISDDKRINYILGQPSACTKIYSKRFLDSISFSFDTGLFYEDLSIIPSLAVYTDRIIMIDDCLYYYNIRNNSIMHNVNFSNKKDDKFEAIRNLEKRILNEYYDEMEYIVLKQLVIMYSFEILKYSRNVYKPRIKRIIEKMEKLYDNYQENKYYKGESLANKIYIYLILNDYPLIAKVLLFMCGKNKDY